MALVYDLEEEGLSIKREQRLGLEPDVTRVEVGEGRNDQNRSSRDYCHSSQKCCMDHVGLSTLHRSQGRTCRMDWVLGCTRLECCSSGGTGQGNDHRGLHNLVGYKRAWVEKKDWISEHLPRRLL